MSLIQCLLKITYNLLLFISLGLSAAPPQESIISIALSNSKIALSKGDRFYVAQVKDARPRPGRMLGEVITPGGNRQLGFDDSLDEVLAKFLSKAAPKQNDDQIPLILTVTKYNILESRKSTSKIAGNMDVRISISRMRNGQSISLNEVYGGFNYTRGNAPYTYAQLLQKVTTDVLLNIDKWFVSNDGINPALIQKLVVSFPRKRFQDNEDTVFYHASRKLTWDDFKARPSGKGIYSATVCASFGYDAQSKVSNNVLELAIFVKVYVVKSLSWVHLEGKTPYTLAHEQGHFDIARIMGEKLKQKLLKADLSINDYESEMRYQFLDAYREMHHEQAQYDAQSKHGLNKEEQEKWMRKISNQLDSLPE